jgi:hypothetical protein
MPLPGSSSDIIDHEEESIYGTNYLNSIHLSAFRGNVCNDDDYDDTYDTPSLLEEQASFLSRARSGSTISLPLPPLPAKTNEEIPLHFNNVEFGYSVGNEDDDTYDRPILAEEQAYCLPWPRAVSLPTHLCESKKTSLTSDSTPDQKYGDSYQDLKYSLEEGYTPLFRTSNRFIDDVEGQYDDTVPNTLNPETADEPDSDEHKTSAMPEKHSKPDCRQIVFLIEI